MEASERIEGLHATVSPCGKFVAYIRLVDGRLRISSVQLPEQYAEFGIRISPRGVTALRWSGDSALIAVISNSLIEVVDLKDTARRIRLDNGSGGLGQFRTADFVGNERLLTFWEFGRAKIWDTRAGKASDLGDLKTFTNTPPWQLRPKTHAGHPQVLALLSRRNGDDMLSMHFTGPHITSAPQKIACDIRAMSWSPDGRWLAMLASTYMDPCMYMYTADGHRFKTFHAHDAVFDGRPKRRWEDRLDSLGVKEVVWSPDAQIVALARNSGSVPLLNTRTFSPLAVITHSTTIDLSDFPHDEQVPVYQEAVSASAVHTYARVSHPVSPPRSDKDKDGLLERGVAEVRFCCDRSYLATRDTRMQSTVWIWDVARLAVRTVLIQHSNVHKMHWHPSRREILMLDCGESIAYIYDTSSSEPPQPLQVPLPGSVTLSWVPTAADAKPAILATAKKAFCVFYPDGRDEAALLPADAASVEEDTAPFEEGTSEDSLIDMLSGRKPLPSKAEQSYTEMLSLEADAVDEDDMSTGLDDTFREKRKTPVQHPEVDPLDDSEIF